MQGTPVDGASKTDYFFKSGNLLLKTLFQFRSIISQNYLNFGQKNIFLLY